MNLMISLMCPFSKTLKYMNVYIHKEIEETWNDMDKTFTTLSMVILFYHFYKLFFICIHFINFEFNFAMNSGLSI